MHNDHTPYYVRVGDSWTNTNYEAESVHEWVRPLVRDRETDLIELPTSWYLDDLPPMMFIKSSFTSHGFMSPRDVEQLWTDQSDWIVREVGYAVFPITIHPNVSGCPQNQLMLEHLIARMHEAEGIEFVYIKDVALDLKQRSPRK